MTVLELIEELQTFPANARVARSLFSSQCLLEKGQIELQTLGLVREDGWIGEARPDQPTDLYVVLP